MKVILLQDVKSVGKKDQVVEVSQGYANNFLFARKLAVPFTSKSEEILVSQKKQVVQEHLEKTQEARHIADLLKNIVLTLPVKVSKDGKMFGSITSKQILEQLKHKHEIDLDKRKVINFKPITKTGPNSLQIEIYKDVIGIINLNIIKEE